MAYSNFHKKLKQRQSFSPIKLNQREKDLLDEKIQKRMQKKEKLQQEEEAIRRKKEQHLAQFGGEKMPVCGPEYYGTKRLKYLMSLIADSSCEVITNGTPLVEREKVSRPGVVVLTVQPKVAMKKRRACEAVA